LIKHIVSFSGGKDSTALLLMMLDRNMPIDHVVYVDTTKDFPQMYQHIDKVADYIKPLNITRLSFNFDYFLGDYVKTKGKHKGKKGYGWPDFRNRWCTRLKLDLISNFAKAISTDSHCTVIQYVGIAFDEKHRAKKKNITYPLVDWGITESQALSYCYNKGFTWGGLYEKFSRLSCYCCPLSRLSELKVIYNEFPELWQNIKALDQHSYRQIKEDYSLAELELKFDQENLIDRLQMSLKVR
jgi:3'-phosphoadenosine 5'-phosphosulfate sulfotransferase (PAPS reductase)/FAD synthetase